MGPSISIDGEFQAAGVTLYAYSGFNGAVDKHRRRHSKFYISCDPARMLQWGRR